MVVEGVGLALEVDISTVVLEILVAIVVILAVVVAADVESVIVEEWSDLIIMLDEVRPSEIRLLASIKVLVGL